MTLDTPVFIYGTLKRGLPNHKYLPAGMSFVRSMITVDPYPLVVGPHGVPFLLDLPGRSGAFRVQGELFSADADAVAFLDQFEGTHTRFYRRVEVDVVDENGGQRTRASTYVRHPEEGGPAFMREWTVARLELQECISTYTSEIAASEFVARDCR